MRELHDCTFLLSLLHLHTTDHPLFDELVGWKRSETRRSDVGSVGRETLERSIFPIAPPLPSSTTPPLLHSARIPPRYT